MNKNVIDMMAHFTWCCKDYPAMKKFYGETLGLKTQFVIPITDIEINGFKEMGYPVTAKPGDDWITYFKVADRQYIELFNIPYEGDNDTSKQAMAHVCLMVDDIGEAATELEKRGVKLWLGPSYENHPSPIPFDASAVAMCGSKSFFITDPEGNEIEIMQFTEQSIQVKEDHE